MRLKLSREQKVAHRFLSSFTVVDYRMKSAVEGLERAESARTSITSSMDELSMSASQSDKMLSAMLRMDDAIDSISDLAAGFGEQFRQVESYVSAVQRIDGKAGLTLRLVYIGMKSAKEVADEMGCSKKSVYEQLKRGLDITFAILSMEP